MNIEMNYPKIIALIATATLSLAPIGCVTGTKGYYTFEPSPVERAKQEALVRIPKEPRFSSKSNSKRVDSVKAPPITNLEDPRLVYTVTDKHVVNFADMTVYTMRKRAINSRLMREYSASFQVLTAAAAASYAAATGGSGALVVALAGTSAVIPNVQEIFEAKGRSEAFTDGTHLIEEALVRYFETVSSQTSENPGRPNEERLTLAGAQLLAQTTAALRVVESAVAARIPSIETLQRAKGISTGVRTLSTGKIEFSQTQDSAQVGVLLGDATSPVTSSNPEVAHADIDPADPKIITVKKGTIAGIAVISVPFTQKDKPLDQTMFEVLNPLMGTAKIDAISVDLSNSISLRDGKSVEITMDNAGDELTAVLGANLEQDGQVQGNGNAKTLKVKWAANTPSNTTRSVELKNGNRMTRRIFLTKP